MALTFDIKKRSTYAIVFGLKNEQFLLVVDHLVATAMPPHWTSLPLMALEAFKDRRAKVVDDWHWKIYEVEKSTGMRELVGPRCRKSTA
jgi:hypothetical protein